MLTRQIGYRRRNDTKRLYMMIKVAGINLQALNSLDFLANYFRRLSILQILSGEIFWLHAAYLPTLTTFDLLPESAMEFICFFLLPSYG
jgi:hypothetical protein